MTSRSRAYLQISVDEIFGVNVLDSVDYLLGKSQTVHSSLEVFIQLIPLVYPVLKCHFTQFHLNVEIFRVRQPLC